MLCFHVSGFGVESNVYFLWVAICSHDVWLDSRELIELEVCQSVRRRLLIVCLAAAITQLSTTHKKQPIRPGFQRIDLSRKSWSFKCDLNLTMPKTYDRR